MSLLERDLFEEPNLAIRLLEAERSVMEMIATRKPLEGILTTIAINYETQVAQGICSILLMDEDGVHVRHGAGPSLPAAFNEGIDGEPIGPVAGSCGTALFNKQRIIVEDISTDPLWVNYRDLALSFGLQACWSTPILSVDGEVLGTFAIYYRETKSPGAHDFELIDRAANLAKIAIERDRNEKQLKLSEEKYRSLAESIPDYVMRYDANCRHTYMNPSALEISGLREQDVIGKTHRETGFDIEQSVFWEEKIKFVFETGKTVQEQFEWKSAKGPVILDWKLSPEFDTKGKVRSVLGISRDITELKNAEKEIAESEKLLSDVTARFPNSYLSVINREMKLEFNGGEEFTKNHLDPKQNVGMAISDVFSPFGEEVKNKILNAYKRTFEGEAQHFELKLGDQFQLYKTMPLKSTQNTVDSILVVAENITEKKEAESDLAKSESLYRNLTSIAPTAIFQTDVNGACTFVNETWLKFSGMQFEEAMGYGWSTAIHPDDRERVLQEWQDAVADRREFKSEMRFQDKDGKVRWLIAKAVSLFDSEFNVYGHIGIATDITDQKNISELIAQNEQRFRTTLSRITDGFVALDNNWCYTYMNKKAGEIFNRHPEEMVGKHIWTEFPEGIGQPFHAAYLNAMLEQEYTYLEEYYPPYDKWFENHIYPSPEGLTIYFKDITARRAAEIALMESEEKYRTLIEQATDGIFIADHSLNFVLVNSAACDMLGYERDELLELSIPEVTVIEPTDPPLRVGPLSDQLTPIYERKLRRKDGGIVPVEVNANRLTNGNYMAIIRDLSERNKAELERQHLLLRNKQIINTMLDGFILADQQGQIVDVNPAYCNLVGYSYRELLSMSIEDLEGVLSQNEIEARIALMMDKKSMQFETTHKTKHGEKVSLEVSVSIMDFEGEALVAAFVRNVTDKKEAQLELKKNHEQLRKLTAHLQAIREEERAALSRDLHDELGQQLTAIKMDLSWVNKYLHQDDLSDKINETLRMTNEAVATVRRINSDLRPTMLDDLGLFGALEQQLNEFSKRYNIQVELTIETDEPDIERINEIAIFRIFQEALTNVAKHANASLIKTAIRKKNNLMEWTLTDNGVGFDRRRVGSLKSFGLLGMTERAMMINGSLEIQSTPNNGTMVKLSFPLAKNS